VYENEVDRVKSLAELRKQKLFDLEKLIKERQEELEEAKKIIRES